jgi:hypothetical protein
MNLALTLPATEWLYKKLTLWLQGFCAADNTDK